MFNRSQNSDQIFFSLICTNSTQQFFYTFNSKDPTLNPDAAPDPANPMKCSLPILLANKEAPTGNHVMNRPARKYPLTVPRFERNMD